ncbi:MAG: NAD-dependent epimerase/dehydratase family protein [Armatimonadetes bacterium]|nr:NAD-dependent epimerase/dehydratase family protein [Armatimonadota bacterium]
MAAVTGVEENRARVLLTGGSGLVGRTLAPLLSAQWEVTHFDAVDPGDGLPFIEGDLRDGAAVATACRGMEAVVHVRRCTGRRGRGRGMTLGLQ